MTDQSRHLRQNPDGIHDADFAEIAEETSEEDSVRHRTVARMENDAVNVRYGTVLFVYENDAPGLAEPFRAENHIAPIH